VPVRVELLEATVTTTPAVGSWLAGPARRASSGKRSPWQRPSLKCCGPARPAVR